MTVCGSPLLRSLLGAKRTYRFALHMSAFDPKRTLRLDQSFQKKAPCGRKTGLNRLATSCSASEIFRLIAFKYQPSASLAMLASIVAKGAARLGMLLAVIKFRK